MKVFILLFALLATSSAFAQQSNATDRIATQIGRLLMQIEQQQDQLSAQQLQLTQAQAEIKRLKEKYEPSSTEEKKQ